MNADGLARTCAEAVAALAALRTTIATTFAAERRLATEAASLRAQAHGDAALLAHADALDRDVARLAANRAILTANEEPLLARIVRLRASLTE